MNRTPTKASGHCGACGFVTTSKALTTCALLATGAAAAEAAAEDAAGAGADTDQGGTTTTHAATPPAERGAVEVGYAKTAWRADEPEAESAYP